MGLQRLLKSPSYQLSLNGGVFKHAADLGCLPLSGLSESPTSATLIVPFIKPTESIIMIKLTHLAIAATLVVSATASWAEGPTCSANAAEKKLAGAAKTSFMKKCDKDATATCEATAAEKKLAGAAKNSFTKKCVKDAVG